MRILIVSQYFPPETGAAATRWGEYANILSSYGHDVTILCEIPNYPTGIIANGYSKFRTHTEESPQSGIKIIRVPVWANSRQTTLQRFGFFISFMLSAMIKALQLPSYDVVIVSSPPLFVGLVGSVIKVFKKSIVLLDIRDLWPESAEVLGELNSKIMVNIGRLMEKTIYRMSDGFLFTVPGFKKYFRRKFPQELLKFNYQLMNGISSEFIRKLESSPVMSDQDSFKVLYSGNIGLAQNLETIIEAATILKDEDITFQIVGDGARKECLVAMTRQRELTNVEFISSIPRDQLIDYILSAAICVVPLQKSDLFLNAIPSKLIEYMGAGKPVIVSIRGEVEDIVNRSGCGLIVEPENPEQIASSIMIYYNNSEKRINDGSNGAAYVRKHFLKESLISNVLQGITVSFKR